MTKEKKMIIVVDFPNDGVEEFDSKEDAESYINDTIADGSSVEDFKAYEVVQEFEFEEHTTIKLLDE